jgi:alpha-1,2-mannosyltransferase
VRVPGRALPSRLPAYAPALLVTAVALVARLAPVLRGGGLTGVLAYDDGVYYSASDALISGRLPYRDYLLLHPPGITLVLAPFAALGRIAGDSEGLATARVAFMLAGALGAVLVWRVARRVSPRAGIVAGLFYAVWQPAAYAERTTLLEPLVNLGLLAALALLTAGAGRRQVVAAGAVLGLAVAVKAWAVLPFLVLAGWLLRRAGRRAAMAYAGAGAAAAALVCLPFLVLAGPAMLRMVVADQLGRPDNGVPTVSRLASIEGLQLAPGPVTGGLAAVAVILAVAVGLAVAALAWRRPETRVWAALLAVAVALLLTSPSYFAHYGTFAAPALALLAGAGADGLLSWLAVRAPGLRPLVPAAGLVALALLGAHVVTQPEGRRPPPERTVAGELAGARCVAGDSAAALVVADVLSRDLRDGCPVVVDVTGLTYDQDRGDLTSGPTPAARRRDREWQRSVDRYLTGANAVLLDQWRSDGLDARVLTRLEHRDLELGSPAYRVLVPAS